MICVLAKSPFSPHSSLYINIFLPTTLEHKFEDFDSGTIRKDTDKAQGRLNKIERVVQLREIEDVAEIFKDDFKIEGKVRDTLENYLR